MTCQRRLNKCNNAIIVWLFSSSGSSISAPPVPTPDAVAVSACGLPDMVIFLLPVPITVAVIACGDPLPGMILSPTPFDIDVIACGEPDPLMRSLRLLVDSRYRLFDQHCLSRLPLQYQLAEYPSR